MQESFNVQPLTESSTVQQVYEYCTSYNALLKHPDRPRLGIITDLINRIRTYKCQHDLPTLEAAYDAHRRYVLHPPRGKRKRESVAADAGTTQVATGTKDAKRAATATPPLHDSGCQQRTDELESKYNALEHLYHALEKRYRERLEALEKLVKPVEWQPDRRLPQRIHRGFTILGTLGMGQRAIVYECVNRSTNMHVALKVALDPDEPDVVRNDALFIHRIGWRHLIRVHGMPESTDDSANNPEEMHHVDAVEMRLFQGTLRSDRQAFDHGRRKERSPRWCLQHFDGLLKELASWHAQGVVHCDIKPENIVWYEDEQRYALIDFGHAIRADEHALVRRGTTSYTAPEALGGGALDHVPKGQRLATRGDVWSLGLTLAYVCSGKPRQALFSVGECRDEAERRARVSRAVKGYLQRAKDDRKRWLSQQLDVDEPEVKSSLVDLLARMLCAPDERCEVNDVRNHKLWSLLRT